MQLNTEEQESPKQAEPIIQLGADNSGEGLLLGDEEPQRSTHREDRLNSITERASESEKTTKDDNAGATPT